MPILRVKKGKNWQDTPLDTPVFRIGRSSDCDFPVESAFISRQHCEIFQERGEYYLRDLGSRLGTQINGRAIETAQLHSGDQIRLSNKFTAVFVDDDRKPADQTLMFAGAPSKFDGDRLVALDGPLVNQVFPLDKEVIQVGRDGYSDIYLEVNTVSKHHAELIREGDGVVLLDKNSSNGTFVGNRRIHRKQLEPGDLVRFDWVTFRFENEAFRLGRSGSSNRGEWESASSDEVLPVAGDPFDRAPHRTPRMRSPTERLARSHAWVSMRPGAWVALGLLVLLSAAGITALVLPLYQRVFPVSRSELSRENATADGTESWRAGGIPLGETQIYDAENESFRDRVLDNDPAAETRGAEAQFAILELVWAPREARPGDRIDISATLDIQPQSLQLTVRQSLYFREELIAEDLAHMTATVDNPTLSFTFRVPEIAREGPHELWLSFSTSSKTVRRMLALTLRP